MNWHGGSIRLRLGLASVVTIAIALVLSWIGIQILFDRQAISLAEEELRSRTNVLAASFDSRLPPAAPVPTAGG
ncbi:MAG: hypothetical protein MUF63_07010, partial [Rhodobacteraceae bacterium]|nr:hypothetical protein [Paracoccaceae bacterium]